jgi:hypothetical protein
MPALAGYQAACICSDHPDPQNGLVAGGHCNTAQLTGPALCCAMGSWLAGGTGLAGCTCAQVVCKQATDGKCRCNTRAPQPTEQIVASCSGTTCCRGRSDEGCTCGPDACDATSADTLASCQASDVVCPCAYATVPVCN